MKYYAYLEKEKTINQLKRIPEQFSSLIYNYPLVFIEKTNSVIFFNLYIKLDQVQYNVLYYLVENTTREQENKGLSATELFQLAKCRHTRLTSWNKNLTEADRADERIRDIKRRIKNKIISEYKSRGDIELHNCNQLLIYNEMDINGKMNYYLNGDILVKEDSLYYDFEINSAIKSLIYNQKDKNKKYTTEFSFK